MSLNLFNVCAAIPFTKIELLEDGLQDGRHCAGILSPQITARSINIEKRLRIFFLPSQPMLPTGHTPFNEGSLKLCVLHHHHYHALDHCYHQVVS